MFANDVEERVANLLTALGLEWEYEPKTFPLVEKDGKVTSAFSPDFYIPALDLYVEVTTQKTLTRKNAKMRALAEKHPTVQAVLLSRKELDLLGSLAAA